MKTLPLRREPWCNDERAIDNDKKLLAGATHGARGAAVVSNLARRRRPGVSGARARAFVRRTVGPALRQVHLVRARLPRLSDDRHCAGGRHCADRQSVVVGTSVSVRVDSGGRRLINKKTKTI